MNEREKLEADIDVWLDSMTGWSIPARTIKQDIIAWLDRQAAITRAECETCDYKQANKRQARKIKNVCTLNDELTRKLDNLAAERDEKAGLLETAFRRCKELEAENNALLAAHADDVERLDSMGEGELQKQVDELKEKLIAEREAVEACEGCKLTDELRAEIAKRDKGIKRLKAVRDALQEEVEELKAELAIANVKLEGKPDCELCDRTTLLTEVESLTAERDRYRGLFGKALDHADAIIELGVNIDEGLA